MTPPLGKTRRFTFDDDLPYPGVPRVDEYVFLTCKHPDRFLGARRVFQVAYTPDGTVILDIKIDGFINDAQAQIDTLIDAGYFEQDPL
ncbi:hypothetical protein [Actinoplanes sp. NPDC051859]|uniref:hypothetical protein n=1 Tax=Actinoplanes sp. NPDC051859 TaxID=3363909 RepID=UPI0037A431FF